MRKLKVSGVVFIILLFGLFGNAWSTEQGDKININTASIEQLTTLKGIGPSLARRIVEYRQANGDFKTIEDIKQVKGIGEKTLADIKADLSIGSVKTKE